MLLFCASSLNHGAKIKFQLLSYKEDMGNKSSSPGPPPKPSEGAELNKVEVSCLECNAEELCEGKTSSMANFHAKLILYPA